MPKEEVIVHCKKLEMILTNLPSSDIDGMDLIWSRP